jgi:hypothetical protein
MWSKIGGMLVQFAVPLLSVYFFSASKRLLNFLLSFLLVRDGILRVSVEKRARRADDQRIQPEKSQKPFTHLERAYLTCLKVKR